MRTMLMALIFGTILAEPAGLFGKESRIGAMTDCRLVDLAMAMAYRERAASL